MFEASTKPIFFPAIAKIMEPKTALEEYKGTYEGKGVELALITEGEQLAKMILDSASMHRRTPVGIRRIDIMAQNTVAGQELYVPIAEMVGKGFPTYQRCDLFLEVEQGADQLGDDGLNPAANTEQTVGAVKFNVFRTCHAINSGQETMLSIHRAIDAVYMLGEAAVMARTGK